MDHNKKYYDMIFKRKSFHLFRNTEPMDEQDLKDLKAFIKAVQPLDDSIRVEIRIVPEAETTCKRGAQYCIEFYSEEKENDLRNIGYIGEQIDLWLAERNIGALWYGIGRPEENYTEKKQQGVINQETLQQGDQQQESMQRGDQQQESMQRGDQRQESIQRGNQRFVIMMAIARVPEGSFRKNMFKAKRKSLQEIWQGAMLPFSDIIRFAPSACNTQPWFVEHAEDRLRVFRYRKPGKRGIMPANKVTYYNRIDIGIFLFFLEVCLTNDGYGFESIQIPENEPDHVEKVLVAEYRICKG